MPAYSRHLAGYQTSVRNRLLRGDSLSLTLTKFLKMSLGCHMWLKPGLWGNEDHLSHPSYRYARNPFPSYVAHQHQAVAGSCFPRLHPSGPVRRVVNLGKLSGSSWRGALQPLIPTQPLFEAFLRVLSGETLERFSPRPTLHSFLPSASLSGKGTSEATLDLLAWLPTSVALRDASHRGDI